MRMDYLIYPDALEKIRGSPVGARVKEFKASEDGLPYIGGAVYEDEIIGAVKELKEKGYYKHLPEDFGRKYKETMNCMLNNPEEFQWIVRKPSGDVAEPCELEDLMLFTGEIASMVLKPEEIWDYPAFGFSSPSEFIAVASAYIIQQSEMDRFREGYKWTRKRDDGSEIVTQITGDMNADLRIYQTDVAPYPTRDPFGNETGMRPETHHDRHCVAAQDSTEGALFVAVMKYIEQEGIRPQFLEDSAKQLIQWGRSLGQRGGACTEHFGGYDQEPKIFFVAYDIPIPRLDESSSTEQHTTHWIPTLEEGMYGAYVAHNGDLVLSYQGNEGMKNPVKPISARFLPDDAEHLIKGLIYQSARGLGRTSAKQLLDILAFRFSDDFRTLMRKLPNP